MNRIFLFATGESINDINEKEWEYLKTQKTMGIAWFFKKNFETTYYYSHEHDKQPLEIANHIYENKWNTKLFLGIREYYDTNKYNQIISSIKAHKEFKDKINSQICYFTHFIDSWFGKKWNIDKEEPPHKFEDVWAKTLKQPLFGFRGTLMPALNLCSVLGYDEIILCGVDLNNGLHFYESEPSNFEKSLERYNPQENPHSTELVYNNSRGIIDGLKWIKTNIKIASKTSLLLQHRFKYYNILENKNE